MFQSWKFLRLFILYIFLLFYFEFALWGFQLFYEVPSPPHLKSCHSRVCVCLKKVRRILSERMRGLPSVVDTIASPDGSINSSLLSASNSLFLLHSRIPVSCLLCLLSPSHLILTCNKVDNLDNDDKFCMNGKLSLISNSCLFRLWHLLFLKDTKASASPLGRAWGILPPTYTYSLLNSQFCFQIFFFYFSTVIFLSC